ncbi:MAG: histidine phosphatase family protein [Endozoicomonas sp.]
MADSLSQQEIMVEGGIIFVRHGEGKHNIKHIYSTNPVNPSYQPVKLTHTGRTQVKKSANELINLGISNDKICKIIVSPLPRTVETADILMGKLQIPLFEKEIDARAIEADFGTRDGQDYLQFKDADFWFPENPESFGGETPSTISQRMQSLLRSIVNDQKCNLKNQFVIIVSHGIPILLSQQFFGLGDERLETAGYRVIPYQTVKKVMIPSSETKDSNNK